MSKKNSEVAAIAKIAKVLDGMGAEERGLILDFIRTIGTEDRVKVKAGLRISRALEDLEPGRRRAVIDLFVGQVAAECTAVAAAPQAAAAGGESSVVRHPDGSERAI